MAADQQLGRLRESRDHSVVDRMLADRVEVEVREALHFLIGGVLGLIPNARVSVSLVEEDATYFPIEQEDGNAVLAHCHPKRLCEGLPYEGNGERPDISACMGSDSAEFLLEQTPGVGGVRVLHIPLSDADGLTGVLHIEGPDLGSINALQRSQLRHFAKIGALILRNHRVAVRLRTFEQRSRELMENTSDLFLAVDTFGRLTACNSHAFEILGYRPQEVIGKDILELFSGHDVDLATHLLKGAMGDREPVVSAQVHVLGKDGRRVALNVTATAVKREGRVAEWLLIGRAAHDQGRSSRRGPRCEHLAVLKTLPALLSQCPSAASMAALALEQILSTVSADAGCLFLLDPSTSLLRVVAHSGMLQSCADGLDGIRMGECLVGHVAQSAEPLVVKSIDCDPRTSRAVLKTDGMKSAACTPMKAGSTLVGVAAVFSRAYRYFTSEDVGLLSVMGDQVAAAIENARLHERTQQHAERLDRLIQRMENSSAALSRVVGGPAAASKTLAEIVCHLLEASAAGLILLNEVDEATGVEPAAYWPSTRPELATPAVRDLVRLAVQRNTAVVAEDLGGRIELGALRSPAAPGLVSGVCVPLPAEDGFVAGLVALFDAPRSIEQSELRVLDVFAKGVATMVLRNSMLYAGVTAKLDRLSELNRLVSLQKHLLEQSEAVHRQLTSIVLKGEGVHGIAETLAVLIGNPVLVHDPFGALLAKAVPDGCEIDSAVVERTAHYCLSTSGMTDSSRQALPDDVRVAPGLRYICPHPEAGVAASAVIAPAVAGTDCLGSITVLQKNRELNEVDIRAIEHGATVVALEVLRERAALEAAQGVKGDFLRELLRSERVDDLAIIKAHRLGYNLGAVDRVMIVRVDEQDPSKSQVGLDTGQLASRNRMLSGIVNRVACGRAYVSVIDAGESSILLAVLRDTTVQAENANGASILANRISNEVRALLPGQTVSIGIGSSCHTAQDLLRSYREARQSLSLVWSMKGRNRVLFFDQLGVIRLLIGRDADMDLVEYAECFLRPVTDYDRQHSSELLRTLETYLQHDGNLLRTAEALYVHPSTLKYRLGKIEHLCNLDIHDSEAKLNLQVATKVLGLKELSA